MAEPGRALSDKLAYVASTETKAIVRSSITMQAIPLQRPECLPASKAGESYTGMRCEQLARPQMLIYKSVHNRLGRPSLFFSGRLKRCDAATEHGAGSALDREIHEQYEEQGIPKPIVKIDNKSDNFATVVSLEFGDQLGELLDTVRSLKNLHLNIRKAKVKPGESGRVHKFYVTDSHTAEKITKSARLEEIRMSILQNLLYYHPESASELGFGPKAKKPTSRDSLHPLGPKARSEVKTQIQIVDDMEGAYTEVIVKTSDRPGLLTEIVHSMKDININVISAEVDTEGPMAIDQFYVSYHGEPLPGPMVLLLKNSLQYQLALAETSKEESY